MIIKCYSRINWKNKHEELSTPLSAEFMNRMDNGIDRVDTNLVELAAFVDTINSTKASIVQLNNAVVDFAVNNKDGIVTITKFDGTVINIDTAIEKIAVNFSYDANKQRLAIILEDGSEQYVDMSQLITQYEFKNTDTIKFSLNNSGNVEAQIKNGSIKREMLSEEVLTALINSEANAKNSEKNASDYSDRAKLDALLSQSYSVGGTNVRDGEDTDNAKYYAERAKEASGINYEEINEKFDLYVPKTGGTLTGNTIISKKGNENIAYTAENTDTGSSVSLMVGSGKVNHGVHSEVLKKWIVYCDGNECFFDGHTLKSDVPEDARFTDTTYSAGRGIDITNNAFRLADYCQIHSDWNKALGNGFWMASGAANAPTTDGWYYGITIAHNNLYCRQILYRFAANSTILDGNSDRFERVYQNGKWGVWYNTTVRKDVPANAQFTDTKYTHPAYTARTGAPTDNQSPNHGGSFMMAQPVSDGLGHITAINARTVNMPNIYVDYNVAAGTHSHTLNTSQQYLLIGTATYSSNTWNFVCHLKYTSSWQCINVAGNGAPNTSISGNTLTVVLAGSGTVYTSSYILLRIV